MTEQPGIPPAGAAASADAVADPPLPPPVPSPPPAAAWTPAPPPATGWQVPRAVAPPGGSPTWGPRTLAGAGTAPTWGSPAPVQVMARPRVLARSGMGTTLAVAAIMVGVVLGVNIVNAAVPMPTEYVDPGANPAIPALPTGAPGLPGATIEPGHSGSPAVPTPEPVEPGPVLGGTTVVVNERYVLVMPDGWALVESTEVALTFQKGSVTFVVGGATFDGPVTGLAAAYRDVFFQSGNLTGEEPAVGVTSTGIPVAGLNYTGILESAQVDGYILVALEGTAGMVCNAYGPPGAVEALSDDLSLIFNSIRRMAD